MIDYILIQDTESLKCTNAAPKDKLGRLRELGWYYAINEGGWVSPNRDCIYYTNRFPYNGKLYRRFEDTTDAAIAECALVIRQLLED